MISDKEVDIVFRSLSDEYVKILNDSCMVTSLARKLAQSCGDSCTALFAVKDYLILHRTAKALRDCNGN